MRHKTISRWALMFLGFGPAACTTAPKTEPLPSALNLARWETKMRLKDTVKNKTQNLTVDVLGERTGRLRLEASALMGYAVASYVTSATEFRCAVYPKKAFYSGPLSEGGLRPLLGVSLSPAILNQIAFDEPLRGWKCEKGSRGEPVACEHEAQGLRARWSRSDGRRSVRLEGEGFALDWAFGAAQTEVQIKEGTFDLEPPQGFRVIRL